jgi:hypothetical protein
MKKIILSIAIVIAVVIGCKTNSSSDTKISTYMKKKQQ